MSPLAWAHLPSFHLLRSSMSATTFDASTFLPSHRLAAEFGFPVHQNLNGPQMETDYTLTLGWQKTLGDC